MDQGVLDRVVDAAGVDLIEDHEQLSHVEPQVVQDLVVGQQALDIVLHLLGVRLLLLGLVGGLDQLLDQDEDLEELHLVLDVVLDDSDGLVVLGREALDDLGLTCCLLLLLEDAGLALELELLLELVPLDDVLLIDELPQTLQVLLEGLVHLDGLLEDDRLQLLDEELEVGFVKEAEDGDDVGELPHDDVVLEVLAAQDLADALHLLLVQHPLLVAVGAHVPDRLELQVLVDFVADVKDDRDQHLHVDVAVPEDVPGEQAQ